MAFFFDDVAGRRTLYALVVLVLVLVDENRLELSVPVWVSLPVRVQAWKPVRVFPCSPFCLIFSQQTHFPRLMVWLPRGFYPLQFSDLPLPFATFPAPIP